MATTPSQLAARTLRKLRISIVPYQDTLTGNPLDASRVAPVADTRTSQQIAADVLLELGVPVIDTLRPSFGATVTSAEIAVRALRNVGLNPLPAIAPVASIVTWTISQLAQKVLEKLEIYASDEVPSDADLGLATNAVSAVVDSLAQRNISWWTANAIPASVSEFVISLAASLVGPDFGRATGGMDPYGRPAVGLDVYEKTENKIRMEALSGVRGQAIAVAKVLSVHDSLNAAGLVSWGYDVIPAAHAEDYVTLVTGLLTPMVSPGADPKGAEEATETVMAKLHRAALLRGGLARTVLRVAQIHSELDALGLVSNDVDSIPLSLASAYTSLVAAEMAPQFGKPLDPQLVAFARARIKQVAMSGPAGLALAEQKILAVHADLDMRGKTRWSLYDLPDFAEEPYVLMGASLLAAEMEIPADPNWAMHGESMLARMTALPSRRRPVAPDHF